jgi:putative aldouronate transport system substrate-binding protein
MKRTFFLFTVLALLSARVVFGGGGSQQASASGTNKGKGDLSKPGTLSIMMAPHVNTPMTPDLPIVQELQKRTNTTLEISLIPTSDYNTKVQALIAAKQLPDFIMNHGISQVPQLFEDGVFVYLNDYINETLTPNYWKVLQENSVFKRNTSNDDGKILGVYQIMFRLWSCNWIYNDRLLKTLSNNTPPVDLDSLYAFLKEVKQKYPDVYPLGVGPWAGGSGSIKNPIMWIFNTASNWRIYGDDQYKFGPWDTQKEYADALRYINKLYSENLLDPELFSRSDDDTMSLISNDKVALFWSWIDGLPSWGPGGDSGIEMLPNPPIRGPDGKAWTQTNSPSQIGGFVTSAAKDIPRQMAFWDWQFSDEGTVLLNWGIEDDTYRVVNGKKEYTGKIMNSPRGGPSRYWYGLANPHWMLIWESEPEDYLNGKYVVQSSAIYRQSDMFPPSPNLSLTVAESDIIGPIGTDVANLKTTYEARLIQARPVDFDAIFREFMGELGKAGVQKYVDTYKAAYARYLKR